MRKITEIFEFALMYLLLVVAIVSGCGALYFTYKLISE